MITPGDNASAPEHYAAVPVQTANIQAPLDMAAVAAAFSEANRLNGQGVLYPQSERQAQTQVLMQSAEGFAVGGYDIDAGSSFGWPNNVEPAGM